MLTPTFKLEYNNKDITKDVTQYEPIIKANPQVPILSNLPSGIKLKIPVIDNETSIKFTLPPWRK